MIDGVLVDWNACFRKHPCQMLDSSIVVHEPNPDASFTDLTIKVKKAMQIPSADFSTFTHWGCYGNKNCDGVFLIEIAPGLCDLVAVELKSSYDTNHLYEAKEQIHVSLQKSRVLLNTLSSFSSMTLRYTYGIIVSNEPDDGSLQWIKSMSALPRQDWKKDTVGLSLYLDGIYSVQKGLSPLCDTVCPPQYEIYYYKSKGATKTIVLPK